MNNNRILQRPIYGGVFGKGLYALATLPTIAHGLHAVRFMVVDPRRGTVLAIAAEKLHALASARRLLRRHPVAQAANDEQWLQAPLWPELGDDQPVKVRAISRRRREVFDLSEGRCHYCNSMLAVDGRCARADKPLQSFLAVLRDAPPDPALGEDD